jgi:hypothetical protein
MKKIIICLLAVASSAAFADKIYLNATALSSTCTKDSYCSITSVHDIQITNNTGNDHDYSYTYSLCSDTGKCNNTGNSIVVKSHSTWNNHFDNILGLNYSWAGTHQVLAMTTVFGTQYQQAQGSNIAIVG